VTKKAVFARLLVLSIHRDSSLPLRCPHLLQFQYAPDANAYAFTSILPCPNVSLSLSWFPSMRVRTTSALLLRARLLKLGFQLHREVVARVIVVPALLPQMRRRGLRANFLFLGPVCHMR
jgi:hypothetical protein